MWAKAPLLDKPSGTMVDIDIPMILPHEMLAIIMGKKTTREMSVSTDPHLEQLVTDVCSSLKLPRSQMVPIGLHGDGVPHQKHGSVE